MFELLYQPCTGLLQLNNFLVEVHYIRRKKQNFFFQLNLHLKYLQRDTDTKFHNNSYLNISVVFVGGIRK